MSEPKVPRAFLTREWERFVAYKYTPATLATYRRGLLRFLRWAVEQGVTSPQELKPRHLRRWLVDLGSRGLSPGSVRSLFAGVRHYARWLQREEVLLTDVSEGQELPRPWERAYVVLTPAQVERLIGAIRRKRPKALAEFLYSTGARATEATLVRVEDVDFEQGTVTLRGKGLKERVVPIGPRALASLRECVPPRATPEYRPWPVSRNAVTMMLKAAAKRAGLPRRVGAHTLRRSFATNMLEAGAPLAAVQEILGHVSAATTARYIEARPAWVREQYERFHPRA